MKTRAPACLWSQRTTCKVRCSPSIMWVLALNLGHLLTVPSHRYSTLFSETGSFSEPRIPPILLGTGMLYQCQDYRCTGLVWFVFLTQEWRSNSCISFASTSLSHHPPAFFLCLFCFWDRRGLGSKLTLNTCSQGKMMTFNSSTLSRPLPPECWDYRGTQENTFLNKLKAASTQWEILRTRQVFEWPQWQSTSLACAEALGSTPKTWGRNDTINISFKKKVKLTKLKLQI